MIMVTHKPSLLPQLLVAATLAAGFGTLWFVLVIWLGTSVLEAWRGKNRPLRESLVVTTDGTPLLESFGSDNLSLVTYRDLSGRVHDAVGRDDQVPAVSLEGEHSASGWFLSDPGWHRRIKVFMDERAPAAIWYFVHDGKSQGSGNFVGYESKSNRLIGYIGLSGFRARPVPLDEQIPVRGELALGYAAWSSAPLSIHSGRLWVLRPDRRDVPPRLVHVPSGNRLLLVDLDARTVTTAFVAPAPIVSVGVPSISSYSVGKPTQERPILVRAGRKIDKLDHQYRLISTFNIPQEIDRRSRVTWYETDSGQAIVECIRPPKTGEAPPMRGTSARVYRLAADGSIRDSFELVLRTGTILENDQATYSLTALGLPAPAVLLAAVSLMARENEGLDHATASGALPRRAWPSLAAVLALSTVLAAVAWRRARAFGLSPREQAVWAVFVLLFGVPAYAGFLLHRRWPVREPCPSCHARCARDRDGCAECGATFPAPDLKGTEIFA